MSAPPDPSVPPGEEQAAPRESSLRRLPSLVGQSLRLVRAAGQRELVAVTALQLVSAAGIAVQLLVTRNVIAGIVAAGSGGGLGGVLPQVAAFIVLAVVLGVAGAARGEQNDILTERLGQHAQSRILDVTCAVELEAFEDPSFHDRLERTSAGAQTRPLQLVQGLALLGGSVLTILGVSAALLGIEPLLVPVTLLAAVPLWVAGSKRGKMFFRFTVDMTPSERERGYLYGLLTSRDAAKEVRAFGLAGYLRGRWSLRSEERLTQLRRTLRRQRRASVLAVLFSSALLGVAVVGLVALLSSGRMTLAEAATAAGALLLLGSRLVAGAFATDQLFESAPFVSDLSEFLSLEPLAAARRASAQAPSGFEHLVVDDVSFTYPSSGRPALHGVSLEIEAGEVVALVGENGSGKTTLAKLLCGLYQPSAGRITWDGVPTAAVDPDSLRRWVAVVFQDFLRYALPAADNVAMGRHERQDDFDAVKAAAQQAGAHQFLDQLPEGYRTVLGPEFEGGKDLSLGQWQRVALARAFFRDAPFLILDEPTAALDARAEHELFEAIRTLAQGRTVLLISHRFSSVRSADRVYVLQHGELVEQGTHAQLMADDGLYAELFTIQAASYLEAPTA